MCRSRPGPRCSNGGKIRITRAEKHLKAMQEVYDAEKSANGGTVTPARQRIYDNAVRRLEAAKKVYLATPAGAAKLQETIDQLEHKLTRIPRGNPNTPERREYNATERALKQNKREQAEGLAFRASSYQDLHLVKGDVRDRFPKEGERRQARDEARARGMNVSGNAQPTRQEILDNVLASDRVSSLSVEAWPDEAYERAGNWVEKGTNTGWQENSRVRPKAGLGTVVGTPTSRIVRLNLPDGQIVESRADVFVTKNSAGKYVASETIVVSSSFEDASPIDVSPATVGHIIASKRGVNRKHGTNTREFNTEAEAKAYAQKIKNSLNQRFVKDSAKLAREALIGRARKPHEALSKRGWVGWPRYAEPAPAAA